MLVFDLILRLSLLVTLAVLSGFIDKIFPRTTLQGKIAQGVLFGVTAIIGMMLPFVLAPGLVFDGRTIIISLSTLFFGPITGGIAALMTLVYRISIAGVGLPMGIATIVEAFIVGYYFHRVKENRDVFWLNTFRLFLFGLIVHIIMASFIFLLPSRYTQEVFEEVALTIIFVYPVISLLIGKILLDQEVSAKYLEDLSRRESLYRTTLYSIGDAVITTDSFGYVQNMNSIAEELTGWKEKEARGRKIEEVFNIINEFTNKPAENPVERVLREGKVVGLANHTVLISRNGSKIPIADSGAPILDERKNIVGVVLVFRDQTKEREYIRKIEEGEKRYRQFVQFSTDGIWRFDLEIPIKIDLPISEQIELIFKGAFLAECNDKYAQMYGFQKAEEIEGIRLIDVMKPEDRENIEYLTKFIENGYSFTGGISKEYDKDGNVKYFENNLVGIIEDGYLIRAWGTQREITDKYLLELSLKESEEKFRLLAEASLVGIYIIKNYKFIYVNDAFAKIFGYKVEEIEGRIGPLDLTYKEDKQIVAENINKRISGEVESVNYTFRAHKKDGTIIFVEVFGRRIIYQNEPCIIGTMLDITDKVRLQEEIKLKTLQLENTLENTPNVAIQFYDIDGKVIYWNNASEKIYGWTKDEAVGKTLDQLIWSKEETLKFNEILKEISISGESYGPFESKFRRKDGTEGWMMSTTFALPSKTNEQIFVCMDIDITDRKNVENALKEQIELFQVLMNTMTSAILVYRGEQVLFCNDATSQITGYSIDEILSMPLWQLVHPDEREEAKRNLLARMKGEIVPHRFERKLLTKDKKVKWVDYSASSMEWKGQLVAVGTAVDITERKINEELVKIQYKIADALVREKTLYKFLEVVREELSKILDTRNLFVAFYDEETDELYSPFEWDEKMDAPVRWSAKKSLTGKVVKERKTLFLKKEDILNLINSGEIEPYGSRAECWLGVPLVVENRPYGAIVIQSYDDPNAFDEKSVQLMELVATQLSSYIYQKIHAEELRKLSLAVEKSQVGIMITDRNGTIEYVNPKFTEITGYEQDEIIGKSPKLLKSEHHSKDFYKNLWDTILKGKDWMGEIRDRKKSGELFWSRQLISPILNEEGEITNFVSIIEDITPIKNLLEDLVLAKDKALESERLKTAFLANISHEVRTPLNGLMGFAQILESQQLPPPEVKRFAGIIVKKANELLSLFNDILDLSMIETGLLKVSPKKTKINEILYDIYSTFLMDEKVRRKEIEFRLGKVLADDFEIVTDPIRLKQILNNLVENAIKFTKKGFVEFGAQVLRSGQVQFYVKDTGIGIPKDKFEYVFERFQQVETDFLRKEYEGAGLGLPLCKGLVNLLKGDIWFESEFGEGSTFYFTISPLTLTDREEVKIEREPFEFERIEIKRNLVFLVAEDDYVNYFVLEKMLKRNYNCEVLHAPTGKEAVEFVKLRKDIDLILMDIRMPIMDGFTAFCEIKRENANIPVVAVTAYAYSEDKKKILEMGFDDYISKPFEFSEINNKINKLISKISE